MIKLYGYELSGNSYKVRLFLELLQLKYQWVKVDLKKGEHQTPEYLAINPFGQVPLLIDGETIIADAQAILVYLASTYSDQQWLPTDAVSLAQIVRWLSTTAGEIRQGLENARLYYLFGVTNINITRSHQKAEYILTKLNEHLSTRTWLEFEHPTIADIAAYPYIALAKDGKIDLTPYPYVLNWLERVKNLPNYVPMAGI
jgi:glutathione S-transferase